MHPELLNNSHFLRYYKQWQDEPNSIVFAPIADYFLSYGMMDEAMKVCSEGVKKHPSFISGRIVMAKIHLKLGDLENARAELEAALSVAPQNKMAKELLSEIKASREEKAPEEDSEVRRLAPIASWNTVTMAKIYASQGHFDQAREIYRAILRTDPSNDAANKGLAALPAG